MTTTDHTLAAKLGKITEIMAPVLDAAEEMDPIGDDIDEIVKVQTSNIPQSEISADVASEIINLNNMVADFKFVRDSLKENTLNGRRILNLVTIELLENDKLKSDNLITSFAELNKAIVENMKMYMNAYREISNVLLNITKIKVTEGTKGDGHHDLSKDSEAISTLELIKNLSGE